MCQFGFGELGLLGVALALEVAVVEVGGVDADGEAEEDLEVVTEVDPDDAEAEPEEETEADTDEEAETATDEEFANGTAISLALGAGGTCDVKHAGIPRFSMHDTAVPTGGKRETGGRSGGTADARPARRTRSRACSIASGLYAF